MKREVVQAAAHVSAGIAILQAPGQDSIQRRSRNHSKLAQSGNRARQPPTGDTRAHATLNDRRIIAHSSLFHGWMILIGRAKNQSLLQEAACMIAGSAPDTPRQIIRARFFNFNSHLAIRSYAGCLLASSSDRNGCSTRLVENESEFLLTQASRHRLRADAVIEAYEYGSIIAPTGNQNAGGPDGYILLD